MNIIHFQYCRVPAKDIPVHLDNNLCCNEQTIEKTHALSKKTLIRNSIWK